MDTTRLRRVLVQELDIGAQSIDAFILGEHGDTQFPVWSHSSVYGSPISEVYQRRTGKILDVEAMEEKVRRHGFEIYNLKGCTEYGIAGTIAEICRNIFTGSHRALAVSCVLEGEYGVDGVAISLPAVLTQSEVQQIIELQLADDELARFRYSVRIVKSNIAKLPGMELFYCIMLYTGATLPYINNYLWVILSLIYFYRCLFSYGVFPLA
ncbi:hypothetical protein AOY81_04600 [Escherichia coli]|nr:hypothetical protein AOY81_04600 [Escherichia coli]